MTSALKPGPNAESIISLYIGCVYMVYRIVMTESDVLNCDMNVCILRTTHMYCAPLLASCINDLIMLCVSRLTGV